MSDSKALLELAARCEVAEGADRGLDAAIMEAFTDERGCRPLWMLRAKIATGARGTHEAPAFTASLDAAMTLVPEGWCIASLEWWPMISIKAGVTLREVREFGGDYPRTGYDETCGDARSHAATPALALCAASLRAIAQEQSK